MRVLHCPTNVAGQAWEYAQGLRALGVEAKVLTFARHPFGYPDDVCLRLPSEPSLWRRRWRLLRNFLQVVAQFDVIHFHFGGTLLPRYLDLPVLRLLGKKMVMNYWGDDIRLETVAKKANPYYDLMGYNKDDSATVKRATRVARYISTAILPCRELYDCVSPLFKWVVIVPAAIDTTRFEVAFPNPGTKTPLVVHSPSDRNIKGTRYVLEAVDCLRKRHRFEFRLLEGLPHEEVIRITREADIVIDQVLLGIYGVVSMEAMALGKPVLCYIREDLVNTFPPELPIVNANLYTLVTELEKLLVNPELRVELGKRGREYVERYHDCRVVAQKLLEV
jgi:glycosyltransferase involved in cell wall biosynthesis